MSGVFLSCFLLYVSGQSLFLNSELAESGIVKNDLQGSASAHVGQSRGKKLDRAQGSGPGSHLGVPGTMASVCFKGITSAADVDLAGRQMWACLGVGDGSMLENKVPFECLIYQEQFLINGALLFGDKLAVGLLPTAALLAQ